MKLAWANYSLAIMITVACEWNYETHYSDVIMRAIASQITSLTIVFSTVYSGKENIEAPRHWPL